MAKERGEERRTRRQGHRVNARLTSDGDDVAVSSASTLLCVPHSLAYQGPALGAQAGKTRLRDVVVAKGGFSRFRRAAETPFNLILEARP